MPVGQIDQQQVEGLVGDLSSLQTDIDNHEALTNNPHSVTAAQVGAYTTGQVDTLLGDASNLGNGDVSNTELGYLDGVTSGIQGQINTLDSAITSVASDLSTHESDTSNPHSVTAAQVGAVPTSDVGAANGVASLDAQGKVPQSQIPALALERLTVVADQTARYALTTNDVQEGDVVKQTDTSATYVVTDDSNLGNSGGYTLITSASSAPVDSVHGRIGNVVSAAGDYDASQIDNDSNVAGAFVDDALNQLDSDLTAHENNTSNPHSVTAAQVGAYTTGQVDTLLGDVSNIGNGDVSNTELSYLDGVTSGIQGQLDALQPADSLDLVPSGTVNGTNRDFLLQSGSSNVPFADFDPSKMDLYAKRLWQIPTVDYNVIDNGSGAAMIRFTAGSQPLTGWPIHTRGTVA